MESDLSNWRLKYVDHPIFHPTVGPTIVNPRHRNTNKNTYTYTKTNPQTTHNRVNSKQQRYRLRPDAPTVGCMFVWGGQLGLWYFKHNFSKLDSTAVTTQSC